MRLPVRDNDPARIVEDEAVAMIRYAVDHGVNYVDTAYPYHGGKSEELVAKALRDGYREKVKVATKSPTWLLERPEDFDRYLDEQLERLQDSSVNFYLLHALSRDRWPKVKELGVLDKAEKALADGRIRHFGFSFHDGFDMFTEIVDHYPHWEFCQLQYNFMDTQTQAGARGVRYAADRGLGVVVMEPIRGGSLASPPESIQKLWEAAPVARSPAEWALQWVWNHPEVSVVLSGMSTMEQVKENVASAARSGPGTLTPEETAVVEKVRQAYLGTGYIPCTACGYCLPCPHGVAIRDNFDIYNESVTFGRLERSRAWYSKWPEERRAGSCQACAECEEKCPQQLPIRDLLERVHATLGGDAGAREE